MINIDWMISIYWGIGMSKTGFINGFKDVRGELTSLLLQYWEVMGRPELPEFISMLPIEPALEYIEREKAKEHGLMDGGLRIH